MLSDRQKLILKAIVEEYIESIEPVGSKVLTEKPYLDFSSATIRYDMAKLEELGYLEKTHTSSGRIPSQKGYKYYVDYLVTRDYDVVDAFPLIDCIFADNTKARKQAIKEAVTLLGELTNYMIVNSVSSANIRIKRLDLIPINLKEAVLLIVTNQASVSNQLIRISNDLDMDHLCKVIATLNDIVHDKPINEIFTILKSNDCLESIHDYMDYQEELINIFNNAFKEIKNEQVYTSGVTNIFNQPEFRDVDFIKNFLDAQIEKNFINFNTENRGLSIKIGYDNMPKTMKNCSVISIPYSIDDEDYGTIAVIGPTRMEYKKVIPLVEYIANNLSKLYKKK